MKRLFSLLIASITLCGISAQEYDYQFRLILKDKAESTYSQERPEAFLSNKAIERRLRHGVAIDKTDLPVSQTYIQTIEGLGAIVVAKSKWLNSVSVQCADSNMVEQLKALPFVSDANLVWRGKKQPAMHADTITTTTTPLPENPTGKTYKSYYGLGSMNTRVQNGQYLHDAGFKGEGIDIAVIDAGFNNLPRITLLNNVKIKGTKGFVYYNENLFEGNNQHGLNVLSCMAANKPHELVGTAPEANYWLLGSEDPRSEYPVEEDYWVMAIEYADSVGVNVVNTSLGYTKYDAPATGFKHSDLDGKTAFITRGANMATKKGMLVVCSAGNSGNSEWKKITPPADANLVLTVGAVSADSTIAKFSSQGYTADLRIKPEVVGLGHGVMLVDENGLIVAKSGTSFSSPIICGLAACLWQAYPTLTNKDIINAIIESSSQYALPNPLYGYGIPDMKKAMEIAQAMTDTKARIHQKSKKK